jgi:hypothetical protein
MPNITSTSMNHQTKGRRTRRQKLARLSKMAEGDGVAILNAVGFQTQERPDAGGNVKYKMGRRAELPHPDFELTPALDYRHAAWQILDHGRHRRQAQKKRIVSSTHATVDRLRLRLQE